MGVDGSRFTRSRGANTANKVAKRFDRIFVNLPGRIQWEEATIRYLPAVRSDHTPLFLSLCTENRPRRERKPFRFEAAWILHPNFLEPVRSKWKSDLEAYVAVDTLRRELFLWNKRVFGDIPRRKADLLARNKSIQRDLESHMTEELLHQATSLREDLDLTLDQEEALWYQKSRESWLALGNRNTKFFHLSTIIHRRKNKILALRIDEEDTWITDQAELECSVVSFFNLYTLPKEKVGSHKLGRELRQVILLPPNPKRAYHHATPCCSVQDKMENQGPGENPESCSQMLNDSEDTSPTPTCALNAEQLQKLYCTPSGPAPEFRELWCQLAPTLRSSEFFRDEDATRLTKNLKNQYGLHRNIDGSLPFGAMTWWSWKERNRRIFELEKAGVISASFILSQARNYQKVAANQALATTEGTAEVSKISWTKPDQGWVKINIDGASRLGSRHAAARGLIRNYGGNWEVSFVANLGYCSALEAELWAILHGLDMAWGKGYDRIRYVLVGLSPRGRSMIR
ncbi:hypothetical protein V2J09_022238 [Rumex salicifolius]